MDQPPELAPSPEPHPVPAAPAILLRKIFFNDVEVRTGWRLLIFFAILIATPDRAFFFNDGVLRGVRANFAGQHIRKTPPASSQTPEFRPGPFISNDGFSFIVLLGVTAFMAIIERRELRYYGLPLKQAFRGNFWLGCLWGFAAITALLLVLRTSHSFYYGPPAISGWSIARVAS